MGPLIRTLHTYLQTSVQIPSFYTIDSISLQPPLMALGVPETESTTDSRHIYNPRLFLQHQKSNPNSPHNISTKLPITRTEFHQIPSFYEIGRISFKTSPTVLKMPESDSLINFRPNYDLLEVVFRPKPNSNPKSATNTRIHKFSHISLNFSPISLKVPEITTRRSSSYVPIRT